MGSYVFRWPYPAKDVHVTGTFDDWGKTVQLNQVGDVWEKEVDLPSADETIYYKFVVDDKWIVDDAAPKTDDGHWNINNILRPEHIKRKQADPTQSTPGAFPETPAVEPNSFMVNPIPASSGASNPISLPAGQKVPNSKEISSYTVGSTATTSKEDYEKAGTGEFPSYKTGEASDFSVNPIPASSGVGNPVHVPAGEKMPESKDVTSNTLGSTVTTSKEDYEKAGTAPFPSSAAASEPANFTVNPIPASSGIGNPINLPAGAKVPESKDVTASTVDSNVTTSREDYENAGQRSTGAVAGIAAGATAGAAALGGAIASAFKAPEEKKNLIPESSLPMGGEAVDTMDRGPFISSSGPGTTTSDLAARVPLEKKRDATVVDPNTSSSSSATPFLSSAAPGATTSGLAAGVPLAEKRQGMVIDPSNIPSSTSPFISSTGPGTSASGLAAGVPLEQKREATTVGSTTTAAASVPETVKESLAQAHKDPEASASAEAVREKTDVEKELLSKTHRSEATGEQAINAAVPATVQHSLARAHQDPEAATSPEAVKEKTEVEKELLSKTHRIGATGGQSIYADVPAAVQQSIAKSHQEPEAAASSVAVNEKSEMERELLSKTQRTEATGVPATAAAAQSSYYGLATTVPQTVESSMKKAHAAPEAAADTAVVAEKSAVEKELLTKVKSTDEAGEPAPTLAAATSATAPTTASAHKSTGSSPFAAAAVSDGTTDIPETGSKVSHPVEKSEGHTTEYAPVRTDGSAPGVSSAAAAALSDGTEDPTLIDEPAVQMMHQNEAGDTVHDTTTLAEPVNQTSAHASSDKAIIAASTITAHDATTSPIANLDYTTSATVRDVAGLPSTTVEEATSSSLRNDGVADIAAKDASVATGAEESNILVPQNDTTAGAVSTPAAEPKATGVTSSSTSPIPIVSGVPTMASTGTMNTSATGAKTTGPALIGTGSVPAPSTPSAPSAPSTPAKKTTSGSAVSSPANSAATGDTNKKKKHRHRISAFFHKLLD